MNRSRKMVLATAAVTVIVAALVVGVSARADAKNPAPKAAAPGAAQPSSTVKLAPVKEVKSAPHEDVTGNLQPAKGLQIGFEVGGRLARILVRKGAPVAEGQVIAQLDPEMVNAQVAQAEAGLKAAEAQASMAADLAQRNAQLQQTGNVSELQNKSSASGSAGAQAQVLAAKAAVAQAVAARRRHDLRAPFAGVLIDAPDQVGANITGGSSTLFTLEQLDPLTLKVTVSESARAGIKVGAKVHVEAVGGSASTDEAVIKAVIPSADANTRRIPVEITVPNKGARFTAHTLARVLLPLGGDEDALSLPASALASTGGDHVFIVSGSEVRRIPVQVLDRGIREVVVRSKEALSSVVDYPAVDLAEGTKVSVR